MTSFIVRENGFCRTTRRLVPRALETAYAKALFGEVIADSGLFNMGITLLKWSNNILMAVDFSAPLWSLLMFEPFSRHVWGQVSMYKVQKASQCRLTLLFCYSECLDQILLGWVKYLIAVQVLIGMSLIRVDQVIKIRSLRRG